MIFEMTRDYSIIVPLMISNPVSFYVSYRLQRQPIYEALVLQDGVHLPNHITHRSARQLKVSGAMRAPSVTLEASMKIEEAANLMRECGASQLPVMDGERFEGMIAKSQF
jgi:chloride channel protein, CIC family